MNYLQRYRDGECRAVWSELCGLGSAGREGDGVAVVAAFVERAVANLERLRDLLQERGFQFEHPESVLVPATASTQLGVAEIERRLGALPLVLKYWWTSVESLDFTPRQLAPDHIWRDVNGLVLDSNLYLVSPHEAVAQAVELLQRCQEDNKTIVKLMETHPELADDLSLNDVDKGFLPLGPSASNCEPKGFSLPCDGIDAFYYNDGGGDTTFADDLRMIMDAGGVHLSPGLFSYREKKVAKARLSKLREAIGAYLVPL